MAMGSGRNGATAASGVPTSSGLRCTTLEAVIHLYAALYTMHAYVSCLPVAGTDGLKGWLGRINEIPFGALAQPQGSNVWGTGFTPEVTPA